HPDYAQCLNNLAVFYMDRDRYEKAELLCIEAMSIRKKILGEAHPDYAGSLNALANIYCKMEQFEKAESLSLEALAIYKKIIGETNTKFATSLISLAFVYDKMGSYEKAEPLLAKALMIYKKILGEAHPDYAISLNNLAGLYWRMGRYEKAEPLVLQNSLIVIHNLENNFTNLSDQEKQVYLDNTVYVTKWENSFLYNYKKASPAARQHIGNTQLFFKGLILENTKKMLAVLQQSKDTALVSLYNSWLTNKSILSKQYALPVANRNSDLKQVEEKTENLEKELNRSSADFNSQQKSIRINMTDVGKGLQQDEIAIEFVKFQLYNKNWTDSTMYAAYILRKNDSVPIFVPLCEEKQLQQLFDNAGTSATNMVNSFYRGLELGNSNSSSFLGMALYKLIWAPLEPYLKDIKKISYSPAGKLYSIAFHALPVDSNTLLIDKYNLQQYTSTRQVALKAEENQTTKPSDIALFGDAEFSMDSLSLVKQRTNASGTDLTSTSIYIPENRGSRGGAWNDLPGTAEEVKKIKALFDENKIATKSFIQTTASEENLKALSGNSPQILHIATHGFFLPEPDKKKKETGFNQGNTYTLADDPLLRSGLILSGGNYAWSGKTPIEGVEDGIATAYEISQLNLSKTELVVLSACETALGDVKGSEGVFGLQRAFKMAGVKKMIVSLWQVPDKETAELMTAFYTYWMKGKTIEESFTQAQAEMRKKYSPFYWAAFVLVE
ncbi:MAG: CHAT domain-containing tetratricopeptide repeat protein, partial [Chitinophagaceae bacterium]